VEEPAEHATPEQVLEFLRSLPPAERVDFIRASIAACEHNAGAPPTPEMLARIEQFKLEHGADGPTSGDDWAIRQKEG